MGMGNLMMGLAVSSGGTDGSSIFSPARSAKALLDDGQTTNGVYWLDMHGAYSLGSAKMHYCLMDSSYNGGGWTMLWSMNDGNAFASGTNYTCNCTVGNPSSNSDFLTGNWGYDRRNTFTPQANDQFLIRRSDNNDWKRFVVNQWCPTVAGESDGWTTLQNVDGSASGHPQYAQGQMYDSSGNAVSGVIYFNGCAIGGNCGSGNGDGSGFSDFKSWSYGAGGSRCWGGGYDGNSNGGSPLYWDTTKTGSSVYMQMYYRRNGTQ